MKTLVLLGVAILYALLASPVAKAQSAGVSTSPLNNRDVVFMVRQKLDSVEIVRIIQASPCTFDIFPPVLRDLKYHIRLCAKLKIVAKARFRKF